MHDSRFLFYARRKALDDADGRLLFSDIVPVALSSETVAASAFYRALLRLFRRGDETDSAKQSY